MPSPTQMKRRNQLKNNPPEPKEEVQLPNPVVADISRSARDTRTFDPRAQQNQVQISAQAQGNLCALCLFEDGDDSPKTTLIFDGVSYCAEHATLLYKEYEEKLADIIARNNEWED